MSTDSPAPASLCDAHRAAIDEVNCWRGKCVDHFARIEACMTKAVAAMIAHPDGSALKRPTLFGAHVAALKNAVAVDGPFALAGTDLRTALAQCETAFATRNIVIHATGRVLIDERGAWLWLYRFQPTGLKKPCEEGFLTRDQAQSLEKHLRSSRDRLKSRLEQFTAHLAGKSAVTE